MSNEKILVTGGNGMIGSEIVKRLSNKYKVVVIDKINTNLIPVLNKIEFINCDVNNTEDLKKYLYGVKCVIHLAALVHYIPKTNTDKERYIETNTRAAERLFRVCSNCGIEKVLFFSTNDVYPYSEHMIDEQANVCPQGIYGVTKYEAEKAALKVYKETGLPICIFRPASVFGKYDRGSMKSLINLCYKGIIPVIGSGTNTKALAYVKDIAIAVEKYVENVNPFGGEVFNISSGNFAFNDMTNTIEKVYGIKPIKIHLPKWIVFKIFARLPKLSKLAIAGNNKEISCKKIQKQLGYKASYNLEDALKDSKDYYSMNRR